MRSEFCKAWVLVGVLLLGGCGHDVTCRRVAPSAERISNHPNEFRDIDRIIRRTGLRPLGNFNGIWTSCPTTEFKLYEPVRPRKSGLVVSVTILNEEYKEGMVDFGWTGTEEAITATSEARTAAMKEILEYVKNTKGLKVNTSDPKWRDLLK